MYERKVRTEFASANLLMSTKRHLPCRNPTKRTPVDFRKLLRCNRNSPFVGTCSITSCNRITSNFSSSLIGARYFIKSQHTNVAFSQISEKYAFASIILHSAMSIPVTLQPSWAKGTKLPPSPQPTSNTLLFEVNF